jgi:hypothetical protein
MLWRFIDANDGLPDDCIVTFANTGKEAEETLEFVRDCGKYWDVPIVWLEYQWAEETKNRFKVVDFDTAARDGEPFEALIHAKKYLPNPVARFCTIEMKIKTIARYLVAQGLSEDMASAESMSIVGIRADEQRRAAKIEPHRRPLVAAGVTKETVSAFWAQQTFDLGLPNVNGVTPHGNCDLCYLKGANLIESLILEKPSRADWWARMERECPATRQSGARWRNDRPTYGQMQVIAKDQGQLNLAGDETIACFCGD